MRTMSHVHCDKCGRVIEYDRAMNAGWLVAQRVDKTTWYLVVRCPKHITDYARRLAGIKQEYYHEHRPNRSDG